MPAKHLFSDLKNEAIRADKNWQKFTNDSASVLIKDFGRGCAGGCNHNLEIGDVAVRVIEDNQTNYYCQKCYQKKKHQMKVADYEQRTGKRAKFDL
jgi:hypothetical protein